MSNTKNNLEYFCISKFTGTMNCDVGKYLKQPPQNVEKKFKVVSEPRTDVSSFTESTYQFVYTDYLKSVLCKVCYVWKWLW